MRNCPLAGLQGIFGVLIREFIDRCRKPLDFIELVINERGHLHCQWKESLR